MLVDGEDIEETDVLVVGAGPAGTTAAEAAASEGVSVVVIDRRKQIGEPVRCGEFLISTDEIQNIFPDALDLETLFDIPEYLISKHIDLIRIYSPKLRHWNLPFNGFSTERDLFDKYLASRAERAGAVIITDCRFRDLKGEEVITSKGVIRARVVIGADGPLSSVARHAGLERPADLYPAVTAQGTGEFTDACEMYFGNIAPGGYAWIIPKKRGANVGLGVCPRFADGSVNYYFHKFLEWKNIEVGRITGKYVPMSGPSRTTVKGKVMLVGDAAGHVMTVNGGGIPIAMICGRLAGRTAARHVLRNLALTDYEKLWRKEVEKPLITALRTKRLSMLCWGSQSRLELAMRLLGRRRMAKIIRCRPVFP